MKCDVVFIVFLSALIKLKYSSVIFGVVVIFMLYLCFIYDLKRILSGDVNASFLFDCLWLRITNFIGNKNSNAENNPNLIIIVVRFWNP